MKGLALADRKLIKEHSRAHEEFVARVISGRRSPSSGASIYDDGDVDSTDFIVECKMSGNPDKPSKSVSLKLADLEKVFDEASLNKKTPLMALRIYNPDSLLADHKGNVDLICMRAQDWNKYVG